MRSDLTKTHCALCMKLEMCLRTEQELIAASPLTTVCPVAVDSGVICNRASRGPTSIEH